MFLDFLERSGAPAPLDGEGDEFVGAGGCEEAAGGVRGRGTMDRLWSERGRLLLLICDGVSGFLGRDACFAGRVVLKLAGLLGGGREEVVEVAEDGLRAHGW